MNVSLENNPVSFHLESELRDWVRRHGIVLWLDSDNYYSQFVDQLISLRSIGELPYNIHSFRGSYLSLMLQMETLTGGTGKPPLVIHLPGFNEESVRATPLLELYEAGVRYRKKLDTLVTEAAAGKVRPEEIAKFKARESSPSLKQSDDWLSAIINNATGGLSVQLSAMHLNAIIDDLVGGGFISARIDVAEDLKAIWDTLESRIGITRAWRDATTHLRTATNASDIAFAAASWSLAVEYVDDLKRPPTNEYLLPIGQLPRTLIDACRALSKHLRERHLAFYQRTADETEELLPDEIEAAKAQDLGIIDTFRFEEQKVLDAALEALQDQQWQIAGEWATMRLNGDSFWLKEEISRKSAWQLIEACAALGTAITTAGAELPRSDGIDDAVEHYRTTGFKVDQKHRQLEQLRVSLLYPQLPEFERLRSITDDMRRSWRIWADAWAKAFNALCKAHGFLPSASLQQRTIFEDVVRPMTKDGGVTAYFLVDAFRYEMAEELFQSMRDVSATTIHLNARLAELPTITDVGMNVLAIATTNSKLRPIISKGAVMGFSTGEFTVSSPETRKRAMQDRVGGGSCPWLTLEEVINREASSLKKTVAQAKLVIVHSQEIDNAGEKGVGPAVFEKVMQKLRAAWRLLRDAGVKRFVITADHGFLLLDNSTSTAQSHGRKIDPKRRHVFSTVAADHTGEARVALSSLGYDDTQNFLMFPLTTAVFDTGNRAMSFVHGGNSLQERVIPLLTLVHRSSAGGNLLQYAIEGSACDAVAGMHCIGAKVTISAQQSLDFGGQREVELALRVPESPEISVELCQTRGAARIARGSIFVAVGEPFEIFFRLKGEVDARVLVEIYHPSKSIDVHSCILQTRFSVSAATTAPRQTITITSSTESESNWLQQLPEGGIRQLFNHLAQHGAVTESEAVSMLGSQRAFRSFSLKLESYAAMAPFGVRIDVVSGVKRYVREGWTP